MPLKAWNDVGHSFPWVLIVSESQSDSLVYFVATPTQRACARELLRDQKKTKEGKIPGQNRRRQSTEESCQQKSKGGDGHRKAATKRGARTWGSKSQVSQRERMNRRSWRQWGNFARIYARDSPQMHRKLQKSVINSLLALGASPSP